MTTAGLNALAMIRFGHGGGGGLGALLLGLVAIGIVVWALTRAERGDSQKS